MIDPATDIDMGTILAERAIRDCITRYCRGIDRMDLDLVRSCYHPDAIDEHGDLGGDLETYLANLAKVLPRSETSTHFIGNMQIEVEGDVAFAETYCYGVSRRRDGDKVLQSLVAVRYLDRFERRETGWRIAHRKCVMDWSRLDDGGTPYQAEAGYIRGRKDRDDPVYGMRRDVLGG
jgi:ketosteroid isomerase-like protein